MIEGEHLPPETLSFVPRKALQPRMLLAASDPAKNIGVIDPANKSVSEFKREELTDFNKHDYSLFDQASLNERRQEAGVRRGELDTKITEWAEKCVEALQSDSRADQLSNFFRRIPKETEAEDMVNFYNKYFTGDNKTSDLKLFVKDVLARYTHQGQIDIADLKKDLGAIEWFAHVFGSNSSEIVSQLIDAEVKLQTNPDEFVQEGNQNVNNFTEGSNDERLLTFLWANRPPIQPSPPEPSAEPKPSSSLTQSPAREPPESTEPKGSEMNARQTYQYYIEALKQYEKPHADLEAVRKKYEQNPTDIFTDPEYERIAQAEENAKKLLDQAKGEVYQIEHTLVPQVFGTTHADIQNKTTPENMDPHHDYVRLEHAVVEFTAANIANGDVREIADRLEQALIRFHQTMKKVDPAWNDKMTLEEFLAAHTKLLGLQPKPEKPSEKPPPLQIDSVEQLVKTLETHPEDQPITFSITQEGLSRVLPDILVQGLTANETVKKLNPKVDQASTNLDFDSADGGKIKGVIAINASGFNVTVNIELTTSPDGQNLIPVSVNVNPPKIMFWDLSKMTNDYLNNNPLNVEIKKILQKQLEESGKSQRQLQTVGLHINSDTKTLDGEIT